MRSGSKPTDEALAPSTSTLRNPGSQSVPSTRNGFPFARSTAFDATTFPPKLSSRTWTTPDVSVAPDLSFISTSKTAFSPQR